MYLVATAGHVDHGKSTLVQALTGTDPDRLSEEKSRGLTIDLGFAHTTLSSGREISFIDVPGHIRYVRNLLAGIGGVDACIFVVAATEGWKQQSEEHLRILELLQIKTGVVALTKVGLVDEEMRELVSYDTREHLVGTFLENAPIVSVDAPTGVGVGALKSALDAILSTVAISPDAHRPRLFIDRSFSIRGSGAVVTGTLRGGALAVHDELEVIGSSSISGRRVRVRRLQSHGTVHEEVGPGSRVAVNLLDVSHHELVRGDALVAPGKWQPTQMFDASLSVLSSLSHAVSQRGAYLLYIGSGEYSAKVRVLGDSTIPAGEQGWVRLYVESVLPLIPGDRFILRESGRSETVGGGEVVDVSPVRSAAKARPSHSFDQLIAERGWLHVEEFERLTGEKRPADVGDRWVADSGTITATQQQLSALIEKAGSLGLDIANLSEFERAVVNEMTDTWVSAGRAYLGSGNEETIRSALAEHPWLVALREHPFSPPDPGSSGVSIATVNEMVKNGLVTKSEGLFFSPEAFNQLAKVIALLLENAPEGLTVSQIREEIGTSRKYAMPLLSHLDATGVTRRRGDVRIGGPRLPQQHADQTDK